MTAATITPWSTRCSRTPTSRRWSRSATGCALPACLPASALRRAWSRAAAIRRSSRCSTRRTRPRPGWIPAASMSMALGFVTVTIHTTSSGQGHETLVGTVVGEVLEIDPGPDPRCPAGFAGLPAVEFAGRQPHGDHARRCGLPCRAEAEDTSSPRSPRTSSACAEDERDYSRPAACQRNAGHSA